MLQPKRFWGILCSITALGMLYLLPELIKVLK